jgi:mono/diheme cytochrome c family protein
MRTRTTLVTVLVTLAAAGALALAAALLFIFSGFYNVGATDPHWRLTHWLLETGRMRSIQTHATGITAPDLNRPEQLLMGTDHFAAHCAICHGAPGVPRGDIAHGLYPLPPDLTQAAQRYTPPQLFWILKNGIKSTGMPSWNDHGDDELWATVAFLERLPTMTEPDYAKLVMTNIMQGGGQHSHGMQGMDHGAMPGMDHNAMPDRLMEPPGAAKPDAPREH